MNNLALKIMKFHGMDVYWEGLKESTGRELRCSEESVYSEGAVAPNSCPARPTPRLQQHPLRPVFCAQQSHGSPAAER